MEFLDEIRPALLRRLTVEPCDVEALIELGAAELTLDHNYDAAIKYLDRALNCEPQSLRARLWRAAVIFHNMSSFRMAESTLADYLREDPGNPEALQMLASVRRDLGHGPRQVLNVLDQARVRGEKDAGLHYSRAYAMWELGMIGDAKLTAEYARQLLKSEYKGAMAREFDWYERCGFQKRSQELMEVMLDDLMGKIKLRENAL